MTGPFAVERIASRMAAACPKAFQPLWQRFMASQLSLRLARGVFWSAIGAVISRGIGVAGSIVVARLVGISAFGEFTIIQSTVGLFGTFAGLGLGVTATKYVAEMREVNPGRCGRIISFILTTATVAGAVGSLALCVFAQWIATHALGAPPLASLLRCSSGLVLFSTLQGVYSGALGGFEAFKRVAQVSWIGALAGTVPLIGLTFVAGLKGAVWGSVLQVALICAISHAALKKEAALRGSSFSCVPAMCDCRMLWRFGLPAFLSSVLTGPVNWACNTLLANQNHGYVQLALLSAANQLRNVLLFLPLMLGSVLMPMLATLHASGRSEDFVKMMKRQLLLTAGICVALGLPMAVFGRTLMRCYGPEFTGGVPVLLLTLLTTVVNAVTYLLSKSMQSAGRAWLDLSLTGIWALVLLASSFILIPRSGAVGVAMSQLIAIAANAICQWYLFRRLLLPNDLSALRTADVAAQ
jgi:O-antigen/teichoic acid export membrane protein